MPWISVKGNKEIIITAKLPLVMVALINKKLHNDRLILILNFESTIDAIAKVPEPIIFGDNATRKIA